MTPKQMSEVLNLVNKEEILEMDEKLEKALSPSKSGNSDKSSQPIATPKPVNRLDIDHELIIEKFPITDVEKALGLGNVSVDADLKTVPEKTINLEPLRVEEVERLVSQSEEIVHNLGKQQVSKSQSSAK